MFRIEPAMEPATGNHENADTAGPPERRLHLACSQEHREFIGVATGHSPQNTSKIQAFGPWDASSQKRPMRAGIRNAEMSIASPAFFLSNLQPKAKNRANSNAAPSQPTVGEPFKGRTISVKTACVTSTPVRSQRQSPTSRALQRQILPPEVTMPHQLASEKQTLCNPSRFH